MSPEQVESLSRHFRLRPGLALLDAGCGLRYSLRTFGPRWMPGGRLVGVDRDADLLATAGRLAHEQRLGAAATFQVADIHELPFEADTFDAVLVQVVLCHLVDPRRALDELIRVAKPGGCVAVFDNASWLEARGMAEVDARVNERVLWIAPPYPYRSPAQQNALQSCRERPAEDGFDRMVLRDHHLQSHFDPCSATPLAHSLHKRPFHPVHDRVPRRRRLDPGEVATGGAWWGSRRSSRRGGGSARAGQEWGGAVGPHIVFPI